jgi:hypothetical protein
VKNFLSFKSASSSSRTAGQSFEHFQTSKGQVDLGCRPFSRAQLRGQPARSERVPRFLATDGLGDKRICPHRSGGHPSGAPACDIAAETGRDFDRRVDISVGKPLFEIHLVDTVNRINVEHCIPVERAYP